jgi:hypothetical protein
VATPAAATPEAAATVAAAAPGGFSFAADAGLAGASAGPGLSFGLAGTAAAGTAAAAGTTAPPAAAAGGLFGELRYVTLAESYSIFLNHVS